MVAASVDVSKCTYPSRAELQSVKITGRYWTNCHTISFKVSFNYSVSLLR